MDKETKISGFGFFSSSALFLLFILAFPDSKKKEIDTINFYFNQCSVKYDAKGNCKGKETAGAYAIAKISFSQQVGIIKFNEDEIDKLHSCTIFDAENWFCMQDGILHDRAIVVRNGNYQNSDENLFWAVSRPRWYFTKMFHGSAE